MEEIRRDDKCEITTEERNGKRFFKCKNVQRQPNIEEILEEINKKGKIVWNP